MTLIVFCVIIISKKEVNNLALKEENTQVYVTLPKELVAKIDKDATKEMRTRSKQIAKIVMDYYESKGE